MLIEHSVCHEPISMYLSIYIYLSIDMVNQGNQIVNYNVYAISYSAFTDLFAKILSQNLIQVLDIYNFQCRN